VGCVLRASGLICVLVWGSFSSPGAGGLFRGCHVATRPCPRVSVETHPPHVGFSSRSPSVQLSIPRKGVGGREMTRAPPRGPSRSAGIPPRRRKEGGKMGRPRREGDGRQRRGGGEGGRKTRTPTKRWWWYEVKKGPTHVSVRVRRPGVHQGPAVVRLVRVWLAMDCGPACDLRQ
jgi:hypothetical protein